MNDGGECALCNAVVQGYHLLLYYRLRSYQYQ